MLPEWVPAILDGLTGEFGVIVAQGLIIFFLWRLFRESQKERLASEARVDGLTAAVTGLTQELRSPARVRR